MVTPTYARALEVLLTLGPDWLSLGEWILLLSPLVVFAGQIMLLAALYLQWPRLGGAGVFVIGFTFYAVWLVRFPNASPPFWFVVAAITVMGLSCFAKDKRSSKPAA